MSFPRYPKYKDSGVEWLGDVPKHWSVVPIKHIGRLQGGAGFPHDRQGVEGEELSFYKVNALAQAGSDGFLIQSDNTITRDTAKDLGAYIFSPRTIVFAKVGAALLLGRIRLLNHDACIDNNMMGLEVHQSHFRVNFVRHAMSLVRFDLIANPGAVPSLNEGQIGNFQLAIPPLPEQTQIAAFLDRETAKIDALVAEQQRLMELLKEKRQAVISHAVTKGLNPNAPMKPSGIEWLGDVPAHWEVKCLKYNLHLLTEKTDRRLAPVALENIEGWTGRFLPTETEFQGEGIAFETGDILFGKLRPYLAKVYRAESLGEAVGEFFVMRPTIRIDSRFAQYQTLNREFISIVDGSTFGSKMPRASWEFVGGMRVTTPPQEEQTQIADFLDRETAKFDKLTSEAQLAIDLLQERRTALISAAVTGQIDVRQLIEQEPV